MSCLRTGVAPPFTTPYSCERYKTLRDACSGRGAKLIGDEASGGHFKPPKTDHLIGTSSPASQRPMVTYTGMGTVGPGLQGLLRH
ncbi:hypothetical protein TNCV_3628711 [Trichonephila clavipes]|nr:hypothetical protein TNCV_3628711 [Trichonephila clavipes]